VHAQWRDSARHHRNMRPCSPTTTELRLQRPGQGPRTSRPAASGTAACRPTPAPQYDNDLYRFAVLPHMKEHAGRRKQRFRLRPQQFLQRLLAQYAMRRPPPHLDIRENGPDARGRRPTPGTINPDAWVFGLCDSNHSAGGRTLCRRTITKNEREVLFLPHCKTCR